MHACAIAPRLMPGDDARATTTAIPPTPLAIHAAAEQAMRRMAPLWPLKNFVAVNPFLGLTGKSFVDAAHVMAQTAGARMTMPRSFYTKEIECGRISEADLALALRHAGGGASLPQNVADLHSALQAKPSPPHPPLPTVADVATRVSGRDWAALATERISSWAASYFDDGQAAWASPARESSPYAAWREQALVDRTPEVMGLKGFRRAVGALPASAEAMIVEAVARLQLPEAALVTTFHRLLMSIGGWAGHARYRVWQSELRQREDTTLQELLAVRLAWEVALLESGADSAGVTDAWTQAREALAAPAPVDRELVLDVVLQAAYENGWERGFLDQLRQPVKTRSAQRKAVQAAFCIDVRSEVFRRALESASPTVDTLGFAGFFGMPIEVVPMAHTHGGAQCPVLLTPAITVCEQMTGASTAQQGELAGLRQLRRRAAGAWRWFKMAAVSSFAFVETMGWTYAGKLVTDSLGLSRPVTDPAHAGIDAQVIQQLSPAIAPGQLEHRLTGIAAEARLPLAQGALKAMSLTTAFARLVLLAGHGATTVNNPYASGLHCGACGGHTGEANARVAAALLNDPQVRQQLAGSGIDVPADTWFLGALHDTTTDVVTIFDQDRLPSTHVDDLAQLQQWLATAGQRTRLERAAALKLDVSRPIDAQVLARSRDWSQVRPEWGLAGCAAYIIAPRSRSAGVDLDGRVFLNSYDWQQDEDFAVLESIMTAPMVVGSWINLQYYASTVDNGVFGSGNKVLHNVVGNLGVLEGNGGDLRCGLPWQSLHDGEQLVHEPLRMSAVIAAPIEAINRIIVKHQSVRELVDHGWVHLFALPDAEASMQRYCCALQWEAVA